MTITIISPNNNLIELLSQHTNEQLTHITSNKNLPSNTQLTITSTPNQLQLQLKNKPAHTIKKPFHLKDLLSSINSLTTKSTQLEQIINDKITFNKTQNSITIENKTISLTDKETAIIHCLLQSQPKAINKKTLLKNIWQYNQEIDTHTLETHIYRLRKKLKTHASLIQTNNSGYSLST